MLLIDNDTVYGDGIFDTIIGLAKKFGPSLLQSAAKSAASEAGKQLASKVFSPALTSSPAQQVQQSIAPQTIIPTSTGIVQVAPTINDRLDEIISKHRTGAAIDDSIIPKVDNAIDIRDYVKSRRGAGIKYV